MPRTATAMVTMDGDDSVQQAVAVRDGRVVYVGNDAGAAALIGPDTAVTDLNGRMLVPGLIDAHLHPLKGGANLRSCNLEDAALTPQAFQARIQACLDTTAGDGAWTTPTPVDISDL